MSTQKETVTFILSKLGSPNRFKANPMFGEYGLYADNKMVGLICDDQLYIKILPESKELEEICEKGSANNKAKNYYIVEEDQISQLPKLPNILFEIAKSIPDKKPKTKK